VCGSIGDKETKSDITFSLVAAQGLGFAETENSATLLGVSCA
jgi:hypothetical protein